MKHSFYWVFVHNGLQVFSVFSDEELGCQDSLRWDLANEGFVLLWDSAASRKEAASYMKEFYPSYKKFEFKTIPITREIACNFINQHHRHHIAPQGMRFCIGLTNGEKLIGVLTAGNPVSRHLADGFTIEVTRLCVLHAYKHACSKLYAVARRIARELGYQTMITYTLVTEDGASLRATGFRAIGITKGRSWSSKSRPRMDKHPLVDKIRWGVQLIK